jgi:hypothetical protein
MMSLLAQVLAITQLKGAGDREMHKMIQFVMTSCELSQPAAGFSPISVKTLPGLDLSGPSSAPSIIQ